MPVQNTVSTSTPVYTTEQIAHRLIHGGRNGPPLFFDIAPGGSIGVDISGLTVDGQQVARLAFDAWTTVTGLLFDLSSPAPVITVDDDSPGAHTGSSYTYPQDNPDLITLDSARVNVSVDWLNTYGTGFNSYSVMTYIHEIGHALGLAHPGDYPGGDTQYGRDNLFANDSWQTSVMSYFDQNDNTFITASKAFLSTPMAADILAVRTLYGRIPLRTGDTVYGDNSTAGGTYDRMSALRAAGTLGNEVAWAIVDDGGFDTLDLRSSGANQVVDLRPDRHSSVYGLTGNLAIAPGSTIERIMTGAGRDIVYGFQAANEIFTGAGSDTVFGGAGNDVIHGEGAEADMLLGYGGNDTIHAGSGNDTIAGGEGDDALYGGDGNDTIYLGFGNDLAGGGAGNDVIYGGAGTNTIYGGLGRDTVQGGSGNDLIFGGGDSGNALYGNGGNDTIHAGSGNDTIAGGEGDDALYGGDGNNTIYLGLGDDLAGGGAGNDLIFAGAGNNRIWGGLGSDTVHGGPGNDAIDGGGSGANLLLGNGGNDTIHAGSGNDTIAGGEGDDALYGGDGNNTVYLGLGDDLAGGGAGNDLIFAGAGNNRIWGGLGSDTVHGGVGRDILNGGPGADVFVFHSAAQAGIGTARDVIADFETGVDRIDLGALGLSFADTGTFTGTAGELRYLSGFLIGDLDGDGVNDFTIELSGAPTLSAGDFIL